MADQYGRQYDGNGHLSTPEDDINEARVRLALARALECKAHQFSRWAPLDGWLERDEMPIGVFEIKCRKHAYGAFPSVFLNVRKWCALSLHSIGHGVPAYFAVGWKDKTGYVPLYEIDARRWRIGGQASVTLRPNGDIEPVIDVPIDQFRLIGKE